MKVSYHEAYRKGLTWCILPVDFLIKRLGINYFKYFMEIYFIFQKHVGIFITAADL
jgi:hypothetical protein